MSYVRQTSGNESSSSSQNAQANALPIPQAVRAADSAARNVLVEAHAANQFIIALSATNENGSGAALRASAVGLEILRELPENAKDAQEIIRMMLTMAVRNPGRVQNPERIFQCLRLARADLLDIQILYDNCCMLGALLRDKRAGLKPTQQDAETLYLLATDLCMRGSQLPYLEAALSMIAVLAEEHPSSFIPQESCSSFVSILLDIMSRKKLAPEHLLLVFRLIKSGQINGLTSFQTDQLASILLSNDYILCESAIKIPGLADRLLMNNNFPFKQRLEVCRRWRNAFTPISEIAKDSLMEILRSLQREENQTHTHHYKDVLVAVSLYVDLVKEMHYRDSDRALIEQKLLSESKIHAEKGATDYIAYVGQALLPYMHSHHILALLERPVASMLSTCIHDVNIISCLLPYDDENEGYNIIKRLAKGLPECKDLKSMLLSSLEAVPKLQRHSNLEKIALTFFISGLFVDSFPKDKSPILMQTFQVLVKMLCPNNEGTSITFQSLAAQLLNYFASRRTGPGELLFLLSGLVMLARGGHITHFPGIDAAATFNDLMQNFVRYLQDPETAWECPTTFISEIYQLLSQVAKHRLLPFCKGATGQWMGVCVREFLDSEDVGSSNEIITSLGEMASAGHVELLKCISREDMGELLEKSGFDTLKKYFQDNPSEFLNRLRQYFDAGLLPQPKQGSIVRHQALRQINPTLARVKKK